MIGEERAVVHCTNTNTTSGART